MYHYRESGLDNIYLENGYRRQQTAYGEGISIIDTEGLHKAIAQDLISAQQPLNGAELRFLRLEMEMTQKDLAAMLGAMEQTLRLWEKNRKKALPGTADRLLRALYSEYAGGKSPVCGMLQRLADVHEREQVRICFRKTNRRWAPCGEARA
jgi:DNA-binding transcriptional regulator YiaG